MDMDFYIKLMYTAQPTGVLFLLFVFLQIILSIYKCEAMMTDQFNKGFILQDDELDFMKY